MTPKKLYPDADAAVADVFDGAIILVGGFGPPGTPQGLVKALIKRGVKNLTCVTNTIRAKSSDLYDVSKLIENGQVKKVITTFTGDPDDLVPPEHPWRQGNVEVEVVPQGILTERMRAAAAGLGGFFLKASTGTFFEKGREKRLFDGEEFILETPLKADFALIQAHRADPLGNLVYWRTQRNYNPTMAAAADITIVEVEKMVAVGQLDPELVITPGIYVDRIVVGSGSLA